MSSPKRILILSPEAQGDLEDILRYTAETWGDAQMLSYLQQVDEAFDLLRDHPEIGHFSADLADTHRLYLVGSHVIVYRTPSDAVEVVRILHRRMSLSQHM